MNKIRRKNLQSIIDQLEELKGSLEDLQAEEEEYRDNIPENMQESERYPLRSSLDLKLPAARQLPQWGAKPVPVALCGSSVYSQEMTSPLGVTIFLLPERGFSM